VTWSVIIEREDAMNSSSPKASEIQPGTPDLKKEKNITMAVYALQAAAFISGITVIAAVIINYIKKEDVQGTWLESHFRWQIRTFWFGLFLGLIGGLTLILGIGFVILAVDGIWFIYRIVKGWLRLSEGKEMYI
jgi:uncharacterized membrane protein